MMTRRFALLFAWVFACGDDVVSPADAPFEPLCGVDEPVELLQLGDETVASIRRIREGDDLHVIVVPSEDAAPLPVRSMVMDPCGDEVIEVPTNPSFLVRWDEVLVGCVDSDLVRLSAYDDASPEVIARRGCAVRELGEQRITLAFEPGSDVGHLVALEVTGSEVVVRSLLDGVMTRETDYHPAVAGERVFVQTTDLAIRSVDPSTGVVALEVEHAEPEAWSIHAEAIVYRPPVLDPEHPEPLVIHDRRTGAERTLDAEIPTSWFFGWWDEGVLTARPPGPPVGQRWFWLDTGREVIAPEGTTIETVRSDGLVWLGRIDEATGEYALLRWREDEAPELAWSCTYCGIQYSQAGAYLELLVVTFQDARYALWRIDDAGGPARMLTDAVGYQYHVMDDGRVLTVVTGGEHGPLTLSDGRGGPPVTLVPRVRYYAPALTWLYGEPDEIVYETAPSSGTHALYRAHLAP